MVDSNDYRYLMAEYALTTLSRRVKQWGLPWPLNKSRVLGSLEATGKTLKRLRYSFLPADMAAESDEARKISATARELAGLLLPQAPVRLDSRQKMAVAEIRWALSVLAGLPVRLRLGDSNYPEYAVDVFGAEVTRVEPLQGTQLKITRASTGNIALTVVTNIREIRVGEIRAIALLPPVEFHGVISEAMYSSDPLDPKYVGRRVPRSLLHGDLAGAVIRILGKR